MALFRAQQTAVPRLCCKEIAVFVGDVSWKEFIARKIAINDVKWAVFSSLWIAFQGNRLYMTWRTEDLLKNDSAAPRVFKRKKNPTPAQTKVTLVSFKEGYSWLACDVLKSKTKEIPKFLSSSGIRGAKSTSVYNFSAQQLASSGNQRIFNFRVMAVRDIKLRTLLSKNIYLSPDF